MRKYLNEYTLVELALVNMGVTKRKGWGLVKISRFNFNSTYKQPLENWYILPICTTIGWSKLSKFDFIVSLLQIFLTSPYLNIP